jgi:hypothetical protein
LNRRKRGFIRLAPFAAVAFLLAGGPAGPTCSDAEDDQGAGGQAQVAGVTRSQSYDCGYFRRFSPIFGEKIGAFLKKPMLLSNISKTSSSLSKNRQLFWRKYF